MVYFSIKPKTRREDLYDYDRELANLKKAIMDKKPLVLLLGLRRTGKTSLLKVALNELKIPSLVVDCRVFEEQNYIGSWLFIEHLLKELRELCRRDRVLKRFLDSVSSVSIAGFSIEFRRERRIPTSFYRVLDLLDRYGGEHGCPVVIAFDEAQELMKLRGINLLPVIAHSYDYMDNIVFVLTGSMIGLVYRFLRIGEPDSPLYGRYYVEVMLKGFSREQALGFLQQGFRQYGLEPPVDVLERVVDTLGYIPGWLALFGVRAVSQKDKPLDRVLMEVVDEASGLVAREIKRFLETRSIGWKRYLYALEAIASIHGASWSIVKKYLETREGARISDSILYKVLKNLVDHGFIVKEDNVYRVSDPIIGYTVLKKKDKLLPYRL